jgi:hypothetical protein
LIASTEYPDQHLLDAALEIAARRTATRAARSAALMIVAQQVYGWTTTPVVVNSAGGREGVTPYATDVQRCSLASVPILSTNPMPKPPAGALDRARAALAPAVNAMDEDPVVRGLARCVLGG